MLISFTFFVFYAFEKLVVLLFKICEAENNPKQWSIHKYHPAHFFPLSDLSTRNCGIRSLWLLRIPIAFWFLGLKLWKMWPDLIFLVGESVWKLNGKTLLLANDLFSSIVLSLMRFSLSSTETTISSSFTDNVFNFSNVLLSPFSFFTGLWGVF